MNHSSITPSSLLDGLAPDYLRTLALQGQVRHYRKNTLLIQEGDVGVQLYVVLHGNLREFAMSQDSKPREITLSMAGCGDILGLLALEGGQHCSSVITLGPAVCAVVSAESVRVLLQHDPIWPWLCCSGLCSACVWPPKPPAWLCFLTLTAA